jgi:hypothetical protein
MGSDIKMDLKETELEAMDEIIRFTIQSSGRLL